MTRSGADQSGSKRDVRFIGDVPGCFVFLDRIASDPEPQTFAFSARSVATKLAVITADVAAERGERVALSFEGIGIRRGVVERVLKQGFIVSFSEVGAGEPVDARIDWLNKKTRGRAADRRRHKRVIPQSPAAVLILGADRTADCRIKDMSASGAAVISEMQPAIGSLVAVGAVPARVARHFDGGFAVQFLQVHQLTEVEGLLTLRTKRERTLAARRLGFAA